MSGEFGSYSNGYFHEKLNDAAMDAKEGQYELTRLTGKLLKVLATISVSISWAEASDTSESQMIYEAIQELPKLTKSVEDIHKYLSNYISVINLAANQAIEKKRLEEKKK